MTRLVGRQVSPLTMTNVQHIAYILVALIFATLIWALPFDQFSQATLGPEMSFILRGWTWPSAQFWLWLVGCGLLIGLLSFASANAYSYVEASIVAPFEYIYIPVSLFWSILIWRDWPTPWGWVGCSLILGAGLLTIVRENIRDVDTASAAPMPMAASSAHRSDEG